ISFYIFTNGNPIFSIKEDQTPWSFNTDYDIWKYAIMFLHLTILLISFFLLFQYKKIFRTKQLKKMRSIINTMYIILNSLYLPLAFFYYLLILFIWTSE
ncbi:hypothetical protein CI105_06610, partial [Candidatus Izimaplasma bacterium ZiA1]